jgi:hypothetical protein
MNVQTTAPSFDPKLFVGRKKETKLFIDTVRATTRRTYLEFNGIAGQGKSELLKWIYHHAKKEGYLAAYVDFELTQFHRPEIYPILETIAAHLTIQSSPEIFQAFHEKLPQCKAQLQKFYRDSLEKPQEADRRPLKVIEDELVAAFNAGLNTLLQMHKIVFCLDSTEKAYQLAIHNLEEQVLQEQIREPHFMLVTAGQERVVWKNAEIRKLVKDYELSQLTSEEVREQIQRLAEKNGFELQDTDYISDKVLQMTLGHPFSNYKLVDSWTSKFTHPLNRNVADTRSGQGIEALVHTIIEDRILENLDLGEAYPPAKDILSCLAPLRRIEFGTLWYMLSTFLEDWFQGKPFGFFEHLMDKFQKKRIFTPWQLGIGYDLEPVVRNILLWDLRANQPREEYISIERQLAEQYHAWVQHTRDATQIKNILERLYHYATYLHEATPESVDRNIQEQLKEYLREYFTIDSLGGEVALQEQLYRLYREIETDKELAALTDIDELLARIKSLMIQK